MKEKKKEPLYALIPVSIEQDDPTAEEAAASALELYEKYGYRKFLFNGPAPSWRSVGYPSRETFEACAEKFRKVKEILSPKGIECGWWIGITVKAGPSDDFIRMTRFDGSETPFASCPLDPTFRAAVKDRYSAFVRIAKPDFAFTEDDFSIHAAAFRYGCFCKYHLAEFERREGKPYTRVELIERFTRGEDDDLKLLRRWRSMMRDSLVLLAGTVREAFDSVGCRVPIGYNQAGSADMDGDCTEAIARALAGEDHVPMSRIAGAFYNGVDPKKIPERLFHALHTRRHMKEPFRYIHESDTFPHTRFFTTGADMRTIMGSVYSYGFEGSIYQAQQLLDDPNEEDIFAKTFAAERRRFDKVSRLAEQCDTVGIEIPYDPFYHSLPAETTHLPQAKFPVWLEPISRLSMPFTPICSPIVAIDPITAKYYPEEKIRSMLSRFAIIEGEAAAILTDRGFSELIGCSVKRENVARGSLEYDLGARDVIREAYRTEGHGKHMPSTHMFSNGGCGVLYRMEPTCSNTEIISDLYTFYNKHVAPSMTLYKNALGGRALVMGMTLNNNNSQSLYNYRRQRLWQQIIAKYSDTIAFVKQTAHIYVIMNEAVCEKDSGFFGMLTLTNLADDPIDGAAIHLPAAWRSFKKLTRVDRSGTLRPVSYERSDDGIILGVPLSRLEPVYLVFSRD